MNLLFRVFLCFFVFPQTFYLLLFPRIIQLRGLLLLLLWRWTTVLTQLGDGLVWLLGSCKWKWTRRRRSVAIPPPVPPPPHQSRHVCYIVYVTFFFPLSILLNISFRPALARPFPIMHLFFLCQTLTQYPNLHGWHLFVGAKKLRWGFRDGCLDPGCEIERWEPQRRHRNFRDQQGKKKKVETKKIPSPKWARYGGESWMPQERKLKNDATTTTGIIQKK